MPPELPKESADRLNFADADAPSLQQVTNTARGEPEKIVWPLMFFPHMRNHDVNHAARFQDAPEFFHHTRRLGCVFQHDDRKDMIKRHIPERQLLKTADDIHFRIVPGWIALGRVDSYVFRVEK